jgi:hypothetical protein
VDRGHIDSIGIFNANFDGIEPEGLYAIDEIKRFVGERRNPNEGARAESHDLVPPSCSQIHALNLRSDQDSGINVYILFV